MTDPSDPSQAKMRKVLERVVAWIGIFCGVAAVIWRLIWPWTGSRTDLIFIPVSVLGIGCMWWLGIFRGSK